MYYICGIIHFRRERTMGMIKDFKEFAVKGNVDALAKSNHAT
jgi:hypothetical protein